MKDSKLVRGDEVLGRVGASPWSIGPTPVDICVGRPLVLGICNNRRAIGEHNLVACALVHHIECRRDTGWVTLLVKYNVACNEVTHPLPAGRRRNWRIHIKSFASTSRRLNNCVSTFAQGPGNKLGHLNLRRPLLVPRKTPRQDTPLTEVGRYFIVKVGVFK